MDPGSEEAIAEHVRPWHTAQQDDARDMDKKPMRLIGTRI
jgi:hypothetical protein